MAGCFVYFLGSPEKKKSLDLLIKSVREMERETRRIKIPERKERKWSYSYCCLENMPGTTDESIFSFVLGFILQ